MSEGLVDGQSQECCKLRDWCFVCSTYSKKKRERGHIKVCKFHMKALKIACGDNALRRLSNDWHAAGLLLICASTLCKSAGFTLSQDWCFALLIGIELVLLLFFCFLLPLRSPHSLSKASVHLVCFISCKNFVLATMTDKILKPS